jgi:hypothetical protein
VLPTYVVNQELALDHVVGSIAFACIWAYTLGNDPVTGESYMPNPAPSWNPTMFTPYPGFDPLAGTPGHPYTGQNTYNGVDYGPAPNGGEGFAKNVGGNQLPNAPHFTTSF